jgi:hypothetical protein
MRLIPPLLIEQTHAHQAAIRQLAAEHASDTLLPNRGEVLARKASGAACSKL